MKGTSIKQLVSGMKVLIISLGLIFIQSCSKDITTETSPKAETHSAQFLLDYYDLICKITKNTPGFFPPQTARAYGYISVANYEAVRHGIDGAYSLRDQLNEFQNYILPQPELDKEYNWTLCSSTAVDRMIKYMFDKNLKPADKIKLEDLTRRILEESSSGVKLEIIERSIAYGSKIADAVYAYSKTDGGHESYLEPFQLPYTVPNDDHCWVPTGAIKNPLSPKWGSNRPFLINNVARVQPSIPVTFSTERTSEFYREAMFVYNSVRYNTSEQIEIAKYWADDPFATCTPAGHTFNILIQILNEERATLAKASVALARMGIAENDAFIACWKGKYDYVLIRPVSYIQRYIDPNFNTVIGTPPFPAYTSGHSCEIGAGARILTDLFTNGSGYYPFTDYSQLQYGFAARSFKSFDELANECANSRLYGGIHYEFDNKKGLQVGYAIGDNVNKEIKWPKYVR